MAPEPLRVRLHLRLIRVLTVLVDTTGRLEVEVASTRSWSRCPHCGFKTRTVHGTRWRKIRDLPVSARRCRVLLVDETSMRKRHRSEQLLHRARPAQARLYATGGLHSIVDTGRPSNGRIEPTNNLLQGLRRVAHGFTNPDNFAARGLLLTC